MTTIENLEIVKAALHEKRDAIELANSALEKEATGGQRIRTGSFTSILTLPCVRLNSNSKD